MHDVTIKNNTTNEKQLKSENSWNLHSFCWCGWGSSLPGLRMLDPLQKNEIFSVDTCATVCTWTVQLCGATELYMHCTVLWRHTAMWCQPGLSSVNQLQKRFFFICFALICPINGPWRRRGDMRIAISRPCPLWTKGQCWILPSTQF